MVTIIPEGPGSSLGGEESLLIGNSEPTLSHTRFPEGTLDIYDEVRIGYDNDPWFQTF